MASPGGGATTLGGGTAISGGGTPDTGCGTPFRLNLTTAPTLSEALSLNCRNSIHRKKQGYCYIYRFGRPVPAVGTVHDTILARKPVNSSHGQLVTAIFQ